MRNTTMPIIRRLFLATVCWLLAACASPYAAHGWTGGFSDEKVSDNSYRVAYAGNGNTTEDMVVKYWLYRCAELTLQAGYTFFGLVPGTDKADGSGVPADDAKLARLPERSESGFMPVKGGRAPIYIWTPGYGGGSITRYSKRGVIVMYHSRAGATTQQQALSLHAGTVRSLLKPFVDSEGKHAEPSRREVIDQALRYPPPQLDL